MQDFTCYFEKATDGNRPYAYQKYLAAEPVLSRLLRVPTGAGKTAAVILSWLYRLERRFSDAPRRMAYCLPMRVLVEQTRDLAIRWRDRLGSSLQIAALMGGEVDESWEIAPEKPVLLIGTQDMLLSRALNRGYAMRRYRWPVHFGLVNNDVVWVCDEVQLMGDGLATTTQLAAFREQMGTIGRCPTIWMSATMDEGMLKSVDMPRTVEIVELKTEDSPAGSPLYTRLHAAKKIGKAPESCRRPTGLAEFLATHHKAGSQTIAVVNRVARARETFDAFQKIAPDVPCHLMHSRFRPWEKRTWQSLLEEQPPTAGRVLIATQVIEAGVDISSALLVTDLAPWSSLVQRFGRCNRDGKIQDGAEIYWVDRPLLEKAKPGETSDLTVDISRPYEVGELEIAEQRLAGLNSAASVDLPAYPTKFTPTHVLRRRDLIDLFDTTADLSGYDLDVSRFIRSEQDRDVLIAWRDNYPPRSKNEGASRNELCSVPIGDLAALLKTSKKSRPSLQLSTWNALESEWDEVTDAQKLRPGMILIANAKSGCYDVKRGWDPDNIHPVPAVPEPPSEEDGHGEDRLTFQRYSQTLAAHSREVREKMAEIIDALEGLGLDVSMYQEDLLATAIHHDWGKAHPIFQATVNPNGDVDLLAKSKTWGTHQRKYFRHELASALALLQTGSSDLSVYLAAAHHGKVRLSIRAWPGETKPELAGVKFARGVHDGDILQAAQLNGIWKEPLKLDLEPMLLGLSETGERSWMERMVALRDKLGVFRLAYLEALIVSSDCRASGDQKEVLP